MRFNNIIYQKLKFAVLLLLCIFLTGTISAQTQREKKVRQMVDVVLEVVDETGTPIPNASIVVGEGIIHSLTDANGSVSFRGYPDYVVTITAKAYEKVITGVVDLIKNSTVALVKSKLYMTSDDNVALPFMTLKKRNITGSTYVLRQEQLERYPSTDLRNAFTGRGGLEVREYYGSPDISAQEYMGDFGSSEKINVSARGRSMTFMVDNVLTEITEVPLDPNEIESVSVIKDIVGKAMYGPAAADGIIYITTKRGSKNEKSLNVNLEQGFSTEDVVPEWVTGEVYARLNNLAKENDGVATSFTQEDILAYSKNDPYDLYHPSVNYREMMLKDTRSFTRANVSSSGGNDVIQYFAYLGYNGEGDNYKIGAPADYNRVTTRSNINIQVTEHFKIDFDFYGNLSIRRSPNYGWDPQFTSENSSSNPTLGIAEMPDLLADIIIIPPTEFPVYAGYDSVSNTPWYGVTSAYGENPIGNLVGNGFYKDQGRQGSSNIVLDYDMSQILPGLRSRTFLGFNTYNLVRIGKAEDYIAYRATPSTGVTGNDTIILTKDHLGVDQPDMAKLMDYYFQRYVINENLSFEKSFGKNYLSTSLTYYWSETFRNGDEEPDRQQNGILSGAYTYADKYSLMGVLNYSGSLGLPVGSQYDLFPSVGAGWVVSEEGFMSGIKFLDYLKLRAEYGTLGVENFMSPYRDKDNWTYNTSGSAFGPYKNNKWFGSGTESNINRAYPSRIGNPDLDWERSKEISAGFDVLLFNGRLSLEATYFNTLREGSVTQIQNKLPYILGMSGARPYLNYNTTRYFGVESFLQFSDRIGDFRYSVGGSATVMNSERIQLDEPAYRFEYQKRVGKPADAFYGQIYDGKFATDAEAEVLQQYDAKTGDFKYIDMNKDGTVDDNDMSMIGHTSPRLIYSANARFSYKNIELIVIGTGRAFFDLPLSSSPYFNIGYGNYNYSKFVEENIGGAYPRLTFNRVNNNFVSSDFWLTKGGYFKIQNVELSYNLPAEIYKYIGAHGIKIFFRGANLLTFTKVKYVDPESINSGVLNYALNKTFTGGIKLNF